MINFNSDVKSEILIDANNYEKQKDKQIEQSDDFSGSIFESENKNSDKDKIEDDIIKNKKDVQNSHYDENGNYCISYKDGSSEIYKKNEEGNLVLSEKTIKTKNGHKVEYYLMDGNTLNKEKIFDKKNNSLEVINYFGYGNDNIPVAKFKYIGFEENNKFLTSIEKKILQYDGKNAEMNCKINRDKDQKVEFMEYTLKKPNGSSEYMKFDGQRGEEKLNKMMKPDGFIEGTRILPNVHIKYDEKGNIKEKIERKISPKGELLEAKEYDSNGKLITLQNDYKMDDKIGSAYQGRTGDCYLLASLNAMAQCENGQKILKNNISETIDATGQKVYTVQFPGAKQAAESLKTHLPKDKVFVTGSYTVTQSEMDKANLDLEAFSDGDQNVLLYELAFNKYREEVKQTVMDNNINPFETYNVAGLEGFIDAKNPIAGGFASEVDFLLTGKKPDIWRNPKTLENPYGLILEPSTHNVKLGTNVKQDLGGYKKEDNYEEQKKSKNYTPTDNFMESGNLNEENSMLEKIINIAIEDSKDGKIDKNAITAGLFVSDIGDFYMSHAVAIQSIKDNIVTFVDSTDLALGNKRKYEVPLDDFKRCVNGMEILKLET